MTRHGWPTACFAGRATALWTSSTAANDATPATATARSANEVERIPLFMLFPFSSPRGRRVVIDLPAHRHRCLFGELYRERLTAFYRRVKGMTQPICDS